MESLTKLVHFSYINLKDFGNYEFSIYENLVIFNDRNIPEVYIQNAFFDIFSYKFYDFC